MSTRIKPVREKINMVAASIFNNIFGQSNASRLHKALRSQRGMVYDVISNVSNNLEYASFSVNTNCKIKDTEEVIKTIKDELFKIIAEGIKDDEFIRAKKNILKNIKFRSETAGYWVDIPIMKELTSEKEPILPDEYIEILKSITVENVNSFIKNYMANNELLLAGIGDFGFIKK